MSSNQKQTSRGVRGVLVLATGVILGLLMLVDLSLADNNEISSSSFTVQMKEGQRLPANSLGSGAFLFNEYPLETAQYCLFELFEGVVYNFTKGDDQPAFYGGHGGSVAHVIFNGFYPEQTVHTLATTNLTTFATQYVNLTGIEPQSGVFNLLWDPFSEQTVLVAAYEPNDLRNGTFSFYSFNSQTGSTSLLASKLLDTIDLTIEPLGFLSDAKGGLYLFYQQFGSNASVPAVTGVVIFDQTTGDVTAISTSEVPYVIESIGYNLALSEENQTPVFSAVIMKDNVCFFMEILYQPTDDDLRYNHTLVPLEVSSGDFDFSADSWSVDGSILFHYGYDTSTFYSIDTISGKAISKYDSPLPHGMIVYGIAVVE